MLLKMKNIINSIWKMRFGRYLLLTAAVCAVIMTIMLLTGQIIIAEIVDLQKKIIEFCPFCM
jgi:uncharacterized membrane protein